MGQRPELVLVLTENLPDGSEEYLLQGEWFDSDFTIVVESGWHQIIDIKSILGLLKRFKDYGPQLRLGFG